MTRRLAIWLIIALCFVVAIVLAARAADEAGGTTAEATDDGRSFSTRTVQQGEGKGEEKTVGIVHVEGVINNGDSDPGGGSVGGDDLVAAIEAAVDRDYDGIILQVDTPGGAVLASAEVADAIRQAQDEHDVKVVAWMRSTAASGGYYVSAYADRIVAAPSTITGSIGVILQTLNVEGLADKVGVQPITIKSGRNKDILSPYKQLTPEQREILQALIDEAYGDFVDVVAEGRGIDEAEVRRIADGRIYTGRQAKENGLVDEIGTREVAYDAMADLLDVRRGADLRIVDVERTYDFYELLFANAEGLGDGLGSRGAIEAVGRLLTGDAPAGLAAPAGEGEPFVELEYRAVIG